VALGAGRPQVAKLVFAEVVHLTAIGVAVGVAGAMIIARAVQSFVYGLPGPDIVTLAATPAMLAAVIAVAAVLPVRRALRVSPTIALRAE
jgi:ABC-type antimicrobial peptide transport system permease subunit